MSQTTRLNLLNFALWNLLKRNHSTFHVCTAKSGYEKGEYLTSIRQSVKALVLEYRVHLHLFSATSWHGAITIAMTGELCTPKTSFKELDSLFSPVLCSLDTAVMFLVHHVR